VHAKIEPPKQESKIAEEEKKKDEPLKSSFLKGMKELKQKVYEGVHKDAVTHLTVIGGGKFISTSMDGFIKMHDLEGCQTKKAFFVCQSGINKATPLSSNESFAVRTL